MNDARKHKAVQVASAAWCCMGSHSLVPGPSYACVVGVWAQDWGTHDHQVRTNFKKGRESQCMAWAYHLE